MLTPENFKTRLKEADLVTKIDFDIQLKKVSVIVTSNKSKHLLVETELKKLEKFDAASFWSKDRLEENYLVFKTMNKKIGNTKSISLWKSK